MAKKEFKAESKRLLDLMINSIYTHKDIFLRELISNASDASDKLYYKALTENLSGISREDMPIEIEFDKEKRTISIIDRGIGMNYEELDTHLGTIANSGSFNFKKDLDKKEEIDIIGQFGVGFYSAFMVADKVEVFSHKYGEENAYVWISDTSDSYEILDTNYSNHGTKIILHLKDNTDDFNYDEYLNQYKIEELVKKYSDYIHYPIKMEVTTSKKKEDSDEYEEVNEVKTLNSQVPIWKKAKKDITKEEYEEFYKNQFHDYEAPFTYMHNVVEGTINYTSLLYIPSHLPVNYYSNDYQKGLQLFSRGVFISDKEGDLLPEHYRFVKGLVDSEDLNLNISREMLQHDKSMSVIKEKIEKRITSELKKQLANNREAYTQFFKNFGIQLKFGIYHSYGTLKDELQDLLLFYSAKKNDYITLKEYVDEIKDGQENIYFASGETTDKIKLLPQVETVLEKDYDVLLLTDDVDEFCLQMMMNYQEKAFKNVTQGDLNLETEEEKKELETLTKDNETLLTSIKEALGDSVVDVKLTLRVKKHPVCLISSEGMSFEMEKVLNQMPGNDQKMKAGRILEINPHHALFDALVKMQANQPEKVKEYASVLYNQALLIEGFTIDNPVEFSNKIANLFVEANK